jgi:hypothetical protein
MLYEEARVRVPTPTEPVRLAKCGTGFASVSDRPSSFQAWRLRGLPIVPPFAVSGRSPSVRT